ncbi:hypothetical protein PISMIDRAFT_686039, partial [Pisolithus microcarpus 441]
FRQRKNNLTLIRSTTPRKTMKWTWPSTSPTILQWKKGQPPRNSRKRRSLF